MGMGMERQSDEQGQAGEEAFLGALLGMAIGDALGMPAANGPGLPPGTTIRGYLSLTLDDGTVIEAGEFTEETEAALSIVEVATTDRGALDPDLIGPRLVRLEQGDSGHWQDAVSRAALRRAADTLDFQVAVDEDGPVSSAVATRGIPVGLLASVGALDSGTIREDSETVARLTHGSPAQANAVAAVAFAVQLAGRGTFPPGEWAQRTARFLGAGAMHDVLDRDVSGSDLPAHVRRLAAGGPEEQVAAGIMAAAGTPSFEDAVLLAVNAGGPADTIGAVAGALAGAYHGVGDIPQWLIDGLGGRIYVSLASPWFRRAALYRAGVVRDLPMDGGGLPPPRPLLPPRR